jgi:hypothetical protein
MIFALVTGGIFHESAYIFLKKKGKVLLFDDKKNNYLSKKYKVKSLKLKEIPKFKGKNIFFWSPCNDIGSAICDYENFNKYNIRSKIFKNGKFDKLDIFKSEKKLQKKKRYIVKPRFGSGSRGIKFWDNKKINKDKYFIQKFYEGIEISIDVTSTNGKHKILALCPRLVHNYKSALGIFSFGEYPNLKKKVNKLIKIKYKKLKIINGISHIEIILTKNEGIKFIDINLRCGGADVTEHFLKKIINNNLFNKDFAILSKKPVSIKKQLQNTGFILYNSANSIHFKNNLAIFKKLGKYKKLKVSKFNRNKEIDANRVEMLCAKFINKKHMLKNLKNILHYKTYEQLIKIDKKLSLI